VKNEVRVNVLNTPYGGFPWLDLPQHANTNWYNAHNFYGDLAHLDAATLTDVQGFFKQYYAPNNAVLVVTGDFEPTQTLAWIRRYFGPIPAVQLAHKPDISEPRQTEEKKASRTDPLATRPALALGYHMPAQNTADYYAMGLIDMILSQGRDSRLYQTLVQQRGMTAGVSAGVNIGLGNMFNINGPTLYTISLFHDPDKKADDIVAAIDSVITDLQTRPVDQATLDLALVKIRSWLYSNIESLFGFGRADMLASFALFYDDPSMINRLEDEFRKITPEQIMRAAREYLRSTNRTVLRVETRSAT
jgi:predicted Zn-dependent peptidase